MVRMVDVNDSQATLCCELLRANIGTCFMYAGLAKAELDAGKRVLAERSLGLARSSHEAIMRFLGKMEDEHQRNEFFPKLAQLREKLDLLRLQLNPAPI
jgi:hypothetical protein